LIKTLYNKEILEVKSFVSLRWIFPVISVRIEPVASSTIGISEWITVEQEQNEKKKITIRDVARHAGTSYQTVSRVLNGSENVADETRSRIQQAIQELNYRPSVAARALNNNRTNIIAVATPFDSDNLFEDPNLLQVIHGIDREAAKHDYSLLLSTLRSVEDTLSPYRRLLDRQLADGMVVSGETVNEEGIQMVIERGYPVSIVGYNQLGVPCVHADDEGGAFQATEHLLELGHRQIAMISGPRALLAVQARERGFESALRKYGLLFDPHLGAEGDFTLHSGYVGMEQLSAYLADFTAIFAHNDRMAFGAIHWLNERGYSVPANISIVGFDDNPNASLHTPALTTVRTPSMMMGQKAAEVLFSILNGGRHNNESNILETEFIVRSSTRELLR
jgi:DNA-binding LacI/PurR family transcriptional regulator